MERLKDKGLELLPALLKDVLESRIELIQACLSQIYGLSKYLKNNMGVEGYRTLIDHITPFLTELVDHEEPDIRDMARSKLGEIADLMTEADRSNYVLKVCLELVQEQQKDQNKIAGLKLLGQLSGLFQKEFLQGFVVTQLTALSHDPNDNVRVVTVEQMAKICAYIDTEIVTRKFGPEFKRLSMDQNWQVRLNFVEKLVTLAEHIPVDKRNLYLGDILLTLLNDKTRWVKEAALQQLGHFLAILDHKNKNDKLFEEYLKIPKSIAKLNKEPQNKICFSVAETLPKIIEAQGESTWKPLSGLYKLLLEKDEEVKILLAKNIHALSKCLTKSENKNQLLNVMKKEFLSNNVKDERLRQEALKNLANFLEMLDQDKREELADIYSQIQQGNRKWRIRQIIASQIGLLSRLFLEETIVKIIIPISFQLCKDEVASVRETACLQVAALLANNHTKALCQLLITENVKSFATYNRFTLRQAFICMCEGLLDDYPYFKANFLEAFQKLVDDKVINVRIGLAKVLVRHFDRKTPASKEEEIIKIYKQLAKDKAADVVKILKKEHTIIDEVLSCSSEDHSRSQTYSEDNQSEERKHENDVMLEKVEQVKKEDATHPHPQEKDDPKSPLMESEKEHILAKDAQIAIEKIVETKQVDEETPEVKEAIEEAEEINKKSNTSHEAKHEEKIDEVKVDAAAKDKGQREDVVVAPAEQEKSENQVIEENMDDETVATEPDIEHKEDTTIVSDATNDKNEEEDKSATDKPEGEPTKADE